MDYTMKGRVHMIGKTEQVTDTFKKKTLVINTGADYDNLPSFEFKQKNVERLDGLTVGEEVEVHFWVGGREWKGRYFASLTGAKVERITPDTNASNDGKLKEPKVVSPGEENDDLPF